MKKKKVWDYLWDMLFILPAFVLFFAVIWYPLIKSILYSFTNYDGMSKSFDFVGLTNYMKIFSSKYIKAGIGNTLKFAVVNCLLCNIFQLLLALVLDKKLILKRYLRVAFYVPVLLCTVVVSVVFGHIMPVSYTHLYLGKNDHMADISGMCIVSGEENFPKNETADSLVPEEAVQFDWDEMTYRYEEYLPVGLKESTNLFRTHRFIFTDAEMDQCMQPVYKVEGRNLLFF